MPMSAIIDAVKQNCTSLETPETVIAKLKALNKKGDNEKFHDEVEQLTSQLTSLYVKKEIPLNVATKMATKAGIDTLICKTTDPDTRIILKAAEFSSIQAAIQKVNESASAPTAQILSTQSSVNNSHYRGRNYTRGNFSTRGGHYRNTNLRFNRNQYQNQPRNFAFRQNYSRGRGNFHNSTHFQNYGPNSNFQNYGPRNARVLYTQHTQESSRTVTPNNGNMMQQQQIISRPAIQNDQHLSNHPVLATLGQFTQ